METSDQVTANKLEEEFFSRPKSPDEDGKYARLRDRKLDPGLREKIELIWREYKPLCPDQKFLRKAQQDFLAMCWQMHVAVLLKRNGFDVRKPSADAPDILIERNGQRIWIECVSPKEGEEPNKVPVPHIYPEEVFVGPIPANAILLRITSAISAKARQLDQWLSKGIVGSDDMFVIAINGGDLGPSSLPLGDMTYPEMAVFAGGDLALRIGRIDRKVRGSYMKFRPKIWKRGSSRSKGSGEIRTDLFLNGGLSAISAIIWSPYWDSILRDGADFQTIHNPHAKQPLPLRTLPFGESATWEATDGNNYAVVHHDNRKVVRGANMPVSVS